MRENRRAEGTTARRAEWVIPGADVLAGAAEVCRLVHAALPGFTWGRRWGGAWVLGPAPAPRPLPTDLTDSEHAAYLVRLAGLLSFLGAHGLGLSPAVAQGLGTRPGCRDAAQRAGPITSANRSSPACIGGRPDAQGTP